MKTPLQITYRHLQPSEALTHLIHEEVARLEEVGEDIIQGRVVVDEPNLHHRRKHFQVEIVLSLPGVELVAGRNHDHSRDDDAYIVVEHGFASIRHQLVNHLRRRNNHARGHLASGWT